MKSGSEAEGAMPANPAAFCGVRGGSQEDFSLEIDTDYPGIKDCWQSSSERCVAVWYRKS